MAELKITRKKSANLVSSLNYMYTNSKVDAIDRSPAAEIALAELIAATLPIAPPEQNRAEFYRANCLEGVRSFLDQVVELVSINQEQALLAVWGVYDYRMSIISPLTLSDVRPCIGRYIRKLPVRHAEMVKKYPSMAEDYYTLSDCIYA